MIAGEALAQEVQQAGSKPVQQDTVRKSTATQQQAYEQLNQYEQRVRNSADLEIDGLIVDETITKIGRDFYDVFHRQWEAPPMATNYTILIKELPARGNSSLVSLSVNEVKVFEQVMQPRYDVIEEVATYLASAVYEYLVNDQLNKQLEAEGKKAREVF
ncbi:MAG: curli production assembly/transport protein CsgE [Hymenobacteraceae bacterium]|nr:curli production assembly/transport protein CsgE [Hymenobacteraceae bacterium]